MKKLVLGMIFTVLTFVLAGCGGEKDISGTFFYSQVDVNGFKYAIVLKKMPNSEDLYEYKRYFANEQSMNKFNLAGKKIMQYDKKNNILTEHNVPDTFKIIIKDENTIIWHTSQHDSEYKRLSPEEAAKLQLP